MALLNDITLGQYIPTGSVVHKLDPRTKLVSILAMMIIVLYSGNLHFYLLFSGFLVILMLIAKLPILFVLRNLRPFVWLILITGFFHILFTPGKPVWSMPGFGLIVTQLGISNAILFTSRLTILIIVATLLTLTTSPMELADGLEKMLKPLERFGFPAHELAMVTVIALRFIPTLMEEADRLKKAQLARGANFEGNFIKKVRSVLPLLIPLFLSAFRRADQLALAMEARCYQGAQGRTSFQRLAFVKRDYVAISVVLGISVIGLLLSRFRIW